MRRVMIFASCLLAGYFSGISAQSGQGAQGSHHQMMSVQDRVNQLKTQLDLSADQVTKITAIMQSQRDTMQTLRQKFGDDRQGMRQAMTALRARFDKEISAVLTGVQRGKYEALIAQRQKEMGAQGQGHGRPASQDGNAQ